MGEIRQGKRKNVADFPFWGSKRNTACRRCGGWVCGREGVVKRKKKMYRGFIKKKPKRSGKKIAVQGRGRRREKKD